MINNQIALLFTIGAAMTIYQSSQTIETVRLQRISPRDVAVIAAIVFFATGVLAVIFAIAVFSTTLGINTLELRGPLSLTLTGPLNVPLLLIYPLLNSIVGAVGSAITVGFYNLIAHRVGGIRISITR